MIANREIYEIPLLNRQVTDPEGDTPIAALYLIYEYNALDQHMEIHNELESFWYNNT